MCVLLKAESRRHHSLSHSPLHVHSTAAGSTLASSTRSHSIDAPPAQLGDIVPIAQPSPTQQHTTCTPLDTSLDRVCKPGQQTSSKPTVRPPPSNSPGSTPEPEPERTPSLLCQPDHRPQKRRRSPANTPSPPNQPTSNDNSDAMHTHQPHPTQPAVESLERPRKLKNQGPDNPPQQPHQLTTEPADFWTRTTPLLGL